MSIYSSLLVSLLCAGTTLISAASFIEFAEKPGLSKYYKVPPYKVYEDEIDSAPKYLFVQPKPIQALAFKQPVYTLNPTQTYFKLVPSYKAGTTGSQPFTYENDEPITSNKPVDHLGQPIQEQNYKPELSYKPVVYKVESPEAYPFYKGNYKGATSYGNVERIVTQQAYRVPSGHEFLRPHY